MWVALLNLENLYGSQESLVAVFQSALQQNEPLEVYRRLASVYLESDKISVCHLISLYYWYCWRDKICESEKNCRLPFNFKEKNCALALKLSLLRAVAGGAAVPDNDTTVSL